MLGDRTKRFAAAAALASAALGTGCFLLQGREEDKITYAESGLPPAAIEERSRQADELYAPPRTPERVERSFDEAIESISRSNGYRGLWQAARAAAWLADKLPDKSRAVFFAQKGIAAAREAVRFAPERVEPYYYLALNLGRLSDLRRTPRYIDEMARNAEIAREKDERFDRAGPARFLGLLHVRTEGQPFVGFGDLDKALELLRRAVELFPDAENRAAYAEALIADEDKAEARRQLEAAIASPAPPGLDADHREWVERARELLKTQGD